jgi:hypothetical protein
MNSTAPLPGEGRPDVADDIEYENARISDIRIGTGAHDGRGFFTISFDGEGWCQSASPLFTRDAVDQIIAVAGAADLLRCIGRIVRVGRIKGELGPILSVRHVLRSDITHRIGVPEEESRGG